MADDGSVAAYCTNKTGKVTSGIIIRNEWMLNAIAVCPGKRERKVINVINVLYQMN
jgi:hypothetical protein